MPERQAVREDQRPTDTDEAATQERGKSNPVESNFFPQAIE